MLKFIINPAARSGRGGELWDQVKEELDPAVQPYEEFVTEYPGHATVLSEKLSAESAEGDILGFLGGDGTVNEVFRGLPSDNAPSLFYIRGGSGNDFARGLGLRTEPENSAELLRDPSSLKHQKVDRCRTEVSGKDYCFMVSSGIGYDAAVCYDLRHSPVKAKMNRLGLGKLSYMIIGVQNILHCPLTDGTLTDLDTGTVTAFRGMAFLAAHNLPYEGGGFRFAPEAKCDDGKLDVCLVTAKNHLRFLWILINATLFGARHVRMKGVYYLRSSRVELSLNEPLYLHTDGEVYEKYDHAIFGTDGSSFDLLT